MGPDMVLEDARLTGQLDAKIWADVFCRLAKDRPGMATNEETVQSWFAAAIMAGFDYARANEPEDDDSPPGT